MRWVGWLILFSLQVKTSCLLITFANSLDPDQDRLNVRSDLGPNCLRLLKMNYRTISRQQTIMQTLNPNKPSILLMGHRQRANSADSDQMPAI